MTTEIVKASELQTKVFDPLMEMRYGHLTVEYEKDLAKYEKALAAAVKKGYGESESEFHPRSEFHRPRGFHYIDKASKKPVFCERPRKPSFTIFRYSPRRQGPDGIWKPAGGYGLLVNPALNREIRVDRVERYETEMAEGKWITLLSDPIAISEEGHVLNGQHRLAAAQFVTEQKRWKNDPEFLVVWGVDPQEALYADGSRRTAVDEKTIAVKLLSGSRP